MRARFLFCEEHPDKLILTNVTCWFGGEQSSSFMLYCHYLKSYYQNQLLLQSLDGITRRRRYLASIENTQACVEKENTTYICYDLTPKPDTCCYCGYSHCNNPHPDVKSLELWVKPQCWIPLGYDLLISLPQKTKVFSSNQIEWYIFVTDLVANKVLVYNASTKELYPSFQQSQRFMNFFSANKKHKVLSLSTWCLRGMLKGGLDLSHLSKVLPYPDLDCFDTLGPCLKDLGEWPHPKEYFILHHLQGRQ